MKKSIYILLAFLSIISISCRANSLYFRVNQIGYLCDDVKVVVVMSPNEEISQMANSFLIVDVANGSTCKVDSVKITQPWEPMKSCARIYFSSLTTPGEYKLICGNEESSKIKIGNDVYAGMQEVPLCYMRQQ